MHTDGGSLHKLKDRALREQWALSDIGWDPRAVSGLPDPIRSVAADLVAPLLLGERTALIAASRLCEHLDAASAREFCAIQVRDEERHVALFAQLIDGLAHEGRIDPELDGLMREVAEAPTPEGLVLGLQILIEGAGHSFLSAVGRALDGLGDDAWDDSPIARSLRDGRAALEAAVARLSRDEGRHIAFGLAFLRERVPQLDRGARHELEARVEGWSESVIEWVREPDVVDAIGLDRQTICGGLIGDLNRRLAHIGLTSRIDDDAAA